MKTKVNSQQPGRDRAPFVQVVRVFAVVVGVFAVLAAPTDGNARQCTLFGLDAPPPNSWHQDAEKLLSGNGDGLIRYSNTAGIAVAVNSYFFTHPGECDCLTALNLYGHGNEAVFLTGCPRDKGCTDANWITKYNTESWMDTFKDLGKKMCTGGTIRLIGCNVGKCDDAGPLLYTMAKLANTRVEAPVRTVWTTEFIDIIRDATLWQFGDPRALAPQACKKLRSTKAPPRERRAEVLPHCFCNGTTYDDVSSCAAECQASLACFTGICSPLWVNESFEPYEGNPILTGSDVAVSAAATAAALQASATDWYRSGVSTPSVLREGATYRMWFNGWNDDVDGGDTRIGYATSTDGIAWIVQPGPVLDVGAPGTFDEDWVGSPAVLRDGGVYHMWYGGNSDHVRIGHATSTDGANWSRDPVPALDIGPEGAWDSQGVAVPTVLKSGNVFMMWYNGWGEDLWDRIGLATSPDGTHWTRAGVNPVLREGDEGAWDEYGVTSPTVVRNASGYHMFYTGMNADDWDEYKWAGYRRIGYAWSSDGITWQKGVENPVLGPSPPFLDHEDVWDSQGVDYASALWDPNEGLFELYVRGLSLTKAYTIGVLMADTLTSTPPVQACTGDCDGGGQVTVDEILTTVNVALGNANISACTAGDANGDQQITIDEILTAVNNALGGCP